MRVWADILTPKQILFFKSTVDLLKSAGHEVLATSRNYREVKPLAEMQGFELKFVGERVGEEPATQLAASLKRMSELLPHVYVFAPDVSLSVASSDCARISFGLGIKHIAVNDSPHSIVAGKLSLPLSHHLLTPWIIPYSAWSRFGLKRSQITRYEALDPAAWLKRPWDGKLDIRLDPNKKTIVVRLESHGTYMKKRNENFADSLLSKIAKQFSGSNLVALCRYENQLQHVKEIFGSSFIVPDGVVDGRSLLSRSDVFIGMGGTMTTEAALMGVPAISAFQGNLYTEKFLLSKGLLLKSNDPYRIVRMVKKSLNAADRDRVRAIAKRALEAMEDPAAAIFRYLTHVGDVGRDFDKAKVE
jgi:predicted glycosyltransferase